MDRDFVAFIIVVAKNKIFPKNMNTSEYLKFVENLEKFTHEILIYSSQKNELTINFSQKIDNLPFKVRTKRMLKEAGVFTINDILDRSESQLLGYYGLGSQALKEITGFLKEHKIWFKNKE